MSTAANAPAPAAEPRPAAQPLPGGGRAPASVLSPLSPVTAARTFRDPGSIDSMGSIVTTMISAARAPVRTMALRRAVGRVS